MEWRHTPLKWGKCPKYVAKWDSVAYSDDMPEPEGARWDTKRGGRMLLGEYQHTLDAKGRLSLPARFRSVMAGRIVVSKGIEHCLYVYPVEDFEQFLSKLTASGEFDSTLRNVRRFFAAGAHETETDSAGRIGIPVVLREYAELGRDVAVIGNGDRIEIWDTEAWAAHNGEITENIGGMTEQLSKLGLA